MLATDESTARTMLRALALTSNAIDAAITQDVDRTDEDRAFFQIEKAVIDSLFDKVEAADRAVTRHDLRDVQKVQAWIEVGDVVLDRGTRRGKKRTALEANSQTADEVFGEDIAEIVDAERLVEPQLVLKCVERLSQKSNFAGKSELEIDLKGRAQQQAQNFETRKTVDLAGTTLDTTLDNAIAEGADGLYKLEKLLLMRFPRERAYVRAFFLDVGRKKKKNEPSE